MKSPFPLKWVYIFGLLLIICIFLYFVYLLKPIWVPILKVIMVGLMPFIIGGFITYLLHPFVEKLYRAGLQRGLAIFLIYLFFFGGTGVAIYKGIPLIIQQLRELSESAPQLAEQYQHWIFHLQKETSSWPDGLKDQIEKRIVAFEHWLTELISIFVNGLMKMVNVLFLLAVIPFISFYLLKDMDEVKKTVWYLTPKSWRRKGLRFLKDLDVSLGGYIRGQILVSCFIGVLSTLLFWFVDMKYPVLLGIIQAIMNIIPYFGPIIGAIPTIIIAATISGKMVLYVAIIILILQFVEGNILSPYIVGKSLHMHPLFIMGALIIGGEIGGVIGLIIAVPVLAVMKVALLHVRTHYMKTPKLH
ncbi:putative PurR-regulated permease PerM [Oikeobacillus pervagus]|uniref:PurR-regulated permease PerM n=1 Tax=Oikeobacillus pervagus TaxID=1325931 RepID=A0AAJ1SZP5_9BACI|nr:AI-2E family transporter [Oikeobacillus pervagus]MDQ0214617.1 putative PurR-regulated permease PerM [Oikeobacillus pervagus]